MTAKIAINGYGTIGKRVAHAVSLQDDMEVVGVTKTRPTYEARMAIDNGFDLYAVSSEHVQGFKDANIPVQGTLSDLLAKADLVVDCAPGKKGAANLDTYKKAGVKAIFQGGEKHETAGFSFNASANYSEGLGKDLARVVSCNTTGLCRTLYPIYKELGIEWVQATMIRRSADPGDSKKGPINAIEPVLKVPSHHGPDVQTVVPGINIQTLAVKVPTTIMHLHTLVVKLGKPATKEQVLDIWKNEPRICFVNGGEGIKSTAQIMEMSRDLGRDRSDFYETVVWKDGVSVKGDLLYFIQAIHQESDVVPDNIDCIRALLQLETEAKASMSKTNKSMGIDN